jgi:hypothetical protein
MAYDNHIKKSHNKTRTTWKTINTETDKNTKKDRAQFLVDKYNDQNVAEMLNDIFQQQQIN